MSAISLKSITGITSITTPAGVDNVFTVHTNDTTERFRVDSTGNLNIAGIVTVTKDLDVDGTTNLDNVDIVGITTIRNASGTKLYEGVANGSKLFHAGTERLSTETYGIDINGELQCDALDVDGNGDISGNLVLGGDLDVDGHTNLDNVSIAGVSTITGISNHSSRIQMLAGNAVRFLNNANSASTEIKCDGGARLNITSYNQTMAHFENGQSIIFYTNSGQNRLQITNDGNVLIAKDLDVDGHTNLDNVSVAGVSTFTGNIKQTAPGTNTAKITLNNASDTTGMDVGYSEGSGVGFINVGQSGSGLSIKTGGTAAGNERLRIDGNGRFIFGHTAALQKFHGPYGTNKRNPQIQINGVNVQQASMSLTSWDNNVVGYYGPAIFLAKSGSSTIGTNSRVSNINSILGSIIFSGDDGDEFVKGAMIQAAVDTSTGNNDMPGRLMFLTTADGAQEPTERLRIDSSGNITAVNTASGGQSVTLKIGASNASGVNDGIIKIVNGGTGNGVIQWDYEGNANRAQIYVYRSEQELRFTTAGSERLRITSDGKLLIGTSNTNNAFSGGDDLIIGNTNSGTRSGITLVSATDQDGGLYFSDGTSSGNSNVQGQVVYDHSNHYLRLYVAADEKVRILGNTTDNVIQIRGGNNLSISDYAPNQTYSGTYVGFHCDNHGNTIIGLNAHLHYSSNSGTHQWKQTNAHSTIGSAGMFIGGNGSNNNSDITFFRNGQGSSAGTVFAQDSWKFQISSKLRQNFNLQYLQRGYFKTDTNQQNANNFPLAAGSGVGGYAFGYQEAYSTSSGSWVHPYPNLVLAYHTGMQFGAYRNYGGCRFYQDHPSGNTSTVLEIGNNSTGVHVTNSFTAGSNKGFRIAHPHPSKKYTHDLVHNAIEAPQMDLIYRGKVDLVAGSATVNIDTKAGMTDGTFVLLNRDIQCFTSNETGWTAVKGSVSGNILTITAQDNSCTDTISWMVVGERQDDKIKESELTTEDGDLIVEPVTIEATHM